jgi:hypothetical protein
MMGHGVQKPLRFRVGLGAGLAMLVAGWGVQPGWALPGQSVQDVKTWIRSNPTLRPRPDESLIVQRRATPAERFYFEASIFPVSAGGQLPGSRVIRTERFVIVDLINEITPERMEESLREIYGVEVFSDYRQAPSLFRYPNPNVVEPVIVAPLLQGEVRAGEQFAYWQEIAYDQNGVAQSGRMVVFLKEDLPALRTSLLGEN